MNDKVLNNVPRELLERVTDSSRDRIGDADFWQALEELRALLTAQPQASHEVILSRTASELVHYGPAQELTVLTEQPQASAAQSAPKPQRKTWRAGNPSYLCHHCNTPLMMHDQQIYCPEGPAFASNSTAAQSAPVGEREAQRAALDKEFAPLSHSADQRDIDLRNRVERPCFARGFTAGAAWQRTQSAGVPDAIPMRPFQTVDRGSTNYAAGWNACRKAMLAAAPAQPAAQEGEEK